MDDVDSEELWETYAWTVPFDHVFPQKRKQFTKPSWSQFWSMFPLGCRYVLYYIYLKFKGKLPVMDFIFPAQNKVHRGVPIGGIGCGSIGRRLQGGFCNFQMIPGIYDDCIVPADQFIVTVHNEKLNCVYQKVLSSCYVPSTLQSWDWDFPKSDASYRGLYPRAWTTYHIRELDIVLVCRQISPVIPGKYDYSSLPTAMFVWHVQNNSSSCYHVSLTFTFQNGTGTKRDKEGTVSSEFYDFNLMSGVILDHSLNGLPYKYFISASCKNGDVTRCANFDPNGSGKEVWVPLRKTGMLPDSPCRYQVKNKSLGCAVSVAVNCQPGSSQKLLFNLTWDMPKVSFPEKPDLVFKRYYTNIYGDDGTACVSIASAAYSEYLTWEYHIKQWQKSVLEDVTLPAWFKSALFNELYYISDGGTLWILPTREFPDDDPRKEYGHFMYLEGHEYRMYNTYDVHFYASYALLMLWPSLQSSLQYDFADTINETDSRTMWYLYNGVRTARKKSGYVPHDIGDPCEQPLLSINSYPIHDVSEWKDLNLKFVLQVYRDYCFLKDDKMLQAFYPKVLSVMDRALEWDTDGDGLIENSGIPDQTYDAWVMTGTSSYCGTLWLAALHDTICMAELLEDDKTKDKFNMILDKAKTSFDQKLWNGRYYNFDCSEKNRLSIMSDQLCGLWYLQPYSTDNLLPSENVLSALKTIFEYNVMGYYGGKQGAVNGMMPNKTVDRTSVQSEEMWTGVSYGLSALFLSQGLKQEAWTTAEGVYDTIYNKSGLGFATPEALHSLDAFRSLGYMRPLSIWSIKFIHDSIHSSKS